MKNFINLILFNDAPEPWQMSFQDSATRSMEGIDRLNGFIYYYEILILVLVAWLFISIFFTFIGNYISLKYNNHSPKLEILWTCSPAFVLFSIAIPSFRLIYLTDEITEGNITIKVIGHQWYWSYEYPDYSYDISFDSFMMPTEDLNKGEFRLLEVDNKIVIPGGIPIKFICSSADVVHSFAIPSTGIKMDSVPGRLNTVTTNFDRLGTFYGQCSELCGVFHLGMPIKIEVTTLEKYLSWLNNFEVIPNFVAYSPLEPSKLKGKNIADNDLENENLIPVESLRNHPLNLLVVNNLSVMQSHLSNFMVKLNTLDINKINKAEDVVSNMNENQLAEHSDKINNMDTNITKISDNLVLLNSKANQLMEIHSRMLSVLDKDKKFITPKEMEEINNELNEIAEDMKKKIEKNN